MNVLIVPLLVDVCAAPALPLVLLELFPVEVAVPLAVLLAVPLAVPLVLPVTEAAVPALPVAVISALAASNVCVSTPALALNGAGVITLEYAGNNESVYAGAPNSVNAFPGRFERGSVPGSPAGRLSGL
jgi:hypothetical protein